MRLGAQDIVLVRFAGPGRPDPPDSRSDDLWFQHLAIVVDDIEPPTPACARIGMAPDQRGWPAIAAAVEWRRAGVQVPRSGRPPARADLVPARPGPRCLAPGRVVAAGPFLGIDHSALSVASTRAAWAFIARWACGSAADRSTAAPPRRGWTACPMRGCGSPACARPPPPDLGWTLGYDPPGRPAGMTRPTDLATDWVTLAGQAVARRRAARGAGPRRPSAGPGGSGNTRGDTLIDDYAPLLLRSAWWCCSRSARWTRSSTGIRR